MSNTKYIKLLEQYRSGTISDSDRHKLEIAALDDSFLFDAMEGYAVSGSQVDEYNINELRNLNEESEPKVWWLSRRMMGVAASLIGLIAITYLMFDGNSVNLENNTDQVATREYIKTESNSTNSADVKPAEPLVDYVDDEKLDAKQDKKKVKSTDQKVELVQESATIESKSAVKPTANTAYITDDVTTEILGNMSPQVSEDMAFAKEEVAVVRKEQDPPSSMTAEYDQNVESDIEEVEEESIEEPMADMASNRIQAKSGKPSESIDNYLPQDKSQESLRGNVLDNQGNALIGVNVIIENTEVATISDIDGNWKLPQYPEGHRILFNYTGYESQYVIISESDTYQVVMNEGAVLSEVRVTVPKYVGINKAFPEMGVEDFKLYIKENKKFPLEIFASTKTGDVTVSFTVNTDGSLSNFVNDSEGYDECFDEAVRLLENSGKWSTIPQKQVYRTSYKFQF